MSSIRKPITYGVQGGKEKDSPEKSGESALGSLTDLFSNQFLADLEKICALRSVIPDPKNPNPAKDI